MSASSPAQQAPSFNRDRPSDLRSSTPWHPLSYIVQALPAGLEELSRDLRVPHDGRVLDYGCAEVPYRRFFGAAVDYVAADLPGNPHASLEIRSDGTLPLEDASFDAVMSTQVLEHVTEPRVYLAECYRVLRPGGRLLLSTHGFMAYHPDPVDYWRWTCAGLERAMGEAGFDLERFEGIMGLGATGLQFVQDALYGRCPARLRPVLALFMQSLIRLADRLEGDESRRLNALVFAVVARKP
jgi:SAM-dependent methyltransferase